MADLIPQIDYTSRDYSAIRESLINNIPTFAPQWKSRDTNDFGIILLELWAYVGDILSFYTDRAANEAFLETATQRTSLLSLAKLLGYKVSQATPAGVLLQFTNTHESNTIEIPIGLKTTTATLMNAGQAPLTFETIETAELAPGEVKLVAAVEGTTVTDVLTTSFNGKPNQSFKLTNQNVDSSTLEVTSNGLVYTQISSMIDANPTESVYEAILDADTFTYILFGDNISGRIPGLNTQIQATYRTISGSEGNTAANTINDVISSYLFSDNSSGSGLTVTNPDPATGGSDAESNSDIRNNAPKALKAVNRAVTLEDYASLALQVQNVGKAKADAAVYTNINLYMGILGASGLDSLGDPTGSWSARALAVNNYLAGKIPPGTVVTVVPPILVPITIDITINVSPSYKRSVVTDAVRSAINTLFLYDNVDFAQIVTQQSISVAVANVEGVEYSTITALYRDAGSGVNDFTLAKVEIPTLDSLNITSNGGIV